MKPRRTSGSTKVLRSDLRSVLLGLFAVACLGLVLGAGMAMLNRDDSAPVGHAQTALAPNEASGPLAAHAPPRPTLPMPQAPSGPEARIRTVTEPPPPPVISPDPGREATREAVPFAVHGPTIDPVSTRPLPAAEPGDPGLVVVRQSPGQADVAVAEAPPQQAMPAAAPVVAAVPQPHRAPDRIDPPRLDTDMLSLDRLAVMFLPQDLSGMDRSWQRIDDLVAAFGRSGYDLGEVRTGQAGVPRIFLSAFPDDIDRIDLAEQRKRTFIKAILPLVLRANEAVLVERRRLRSLIAHVTKGMSLAREQARWLADLADKYGGSSDDLADLLRRVDIVPVSLALAQAAEESGWGTSRYARQGNAIFGQWTWDTEAGIVPRNRPRGRNHLVRKFPALQHSVSAYIRNLNSNPAYAAFRSARARTRAEDRPASGHELAGHLTAYSERGRSYVGTLQSIMAQNGLAEFDEVRLADSDSRWTAGLAAEALRSVF